MLSGPAGTGKSRACLEYLYYLAEKFPGCRLLILRKTRESITESALVTWENHVIPHGHPCLQGARRETRKAYRFANGSVVAVAGLKQSGKDQTQRVMSTEWDVIYVQEAIELSEEEWEKATTRLRNGKIPFQQIIADTNPDAPTHWLKRRCDSGKTKMLDTCHEENPVIWDRKNGQWTERGKKYIDALENLTGNRLQRYRFGRWVQAEGVVYTEWDRNVNLIDLPKGPRSDWQRFVWVDFGYTNPFVAIWAAKDHDGRLYVYRQIYRTGRIVSDHAKQIRELNARDWPGQANRPPVAMVCDTDAEDIATLRAALPGWNIIPARKNVSRGIEAVRRRLKPAGDGRPRLMFVRNSLVERDPDLYEAKQPTCAEEEFDCYIMDKAKDEPVKENDHALDAVRYGVAFFDLNESVGTKPKVIIGGPGTNPFQPSQPWRG